MSELRIISLNYFGYITIKLTLIPRIYAKFIKIMFKYINSRNKFHKTLQKHYKFLKSMLKVIDSRKFFYKFIKVMFNSWILGKTINQFKKKFLGKI